MEHPIEVGRIIRAKIARCGCQGGGFFTDAGKVLKHFLNKGTYWYLIEVPSGNFTVPASHVVEILS